MRPAKVWVISDTHFGHQKIIEFNDTKPYRSFATIEEHDRELVRRWNETVRPQDTVYHLGDVYFGQKNQYILGELNGYKKLVLGNHDHYDLKIYERYFARIFGATSYSGCILTHVPVHPDQLEHRFKMNVHGHLHAKKLKDPRYVCVSVEQTDLRPVLLKDVINGTTQTGAS